jgi:glucose-6-phosphate-specific signal transduction histidine kinase
VKPIPRGLTRGLRGTGRTLAGPWPIYPSALALIAVYGLFVSAGSRTQVGNKTVASYFSAVLPQWASIIVTCLLIYAVLRILIALAARVRPVEGSRLAYLGTLIVASALITVFIVVATQITVDDDLRETLPPIAVRFILSLPVVLLVLFIGNGVLASVRARLARQEALLAERLKVVRSERSLLLAAEEKVRAEASRTLHDDVQAALLRSVVRLEGLRDRLDEDDRVLFDASIDEIENVREVRVRALGRVLAPNIDDIGLLQALEELGALYADVMPVHLVVSEQVEERFRPIGEQDDTALALYRITEQGLLNALKHSRSSEVQVALRQLPDGRVHLELTSSGAPPESDMTPGTGTATINAWLDLVGGSWQIDPIPEGGARLTVVAGRSRP